ncbi:unnamed protein product, partial [Amoebophrya sp. A25]
LLLLEDDSDGDVEDDEFFDDEYDSEEDMDMDFEEFLLYMAMRQGLFGDLFRSSSSTETDGEGGTNDRKWSIRTATSEDIAEAERVKEERRRMWADKGKGDDHVG